MKESSFWRYLLTVLPAQGHYSRIESETSPGFPDVHYTLDSTSGTIELKSTKRPTAKYPFQGENGLRQSQTTWIMEETAAGGTVWLFLQCGRNVFVLDGSVYADNLPAMTVADLSHVARVKWLKGTRAPVTKTLSTVLTEPR